MTSHAIAGAVAGALASTALQRHPSFGGNKSKDSASSASSNGGATAATRRGNGKNVGILALEVYTPRTYVAQAALEEHAGVSAGRYTIGLGQEGLAVTGDAEDVKSVHPRLL